jgi:hypothetical protein
MWITFMTCTNYIRGMLEMVCWLSCCFKDRVPFPKDEVLKLLMEQTRVKNLVGLLLFVGQELDWWWRRRVLIADIRQIMRFKKGDVKYIINTKVGWLL